MGTSVYDLDLPELNLLETDRSSAAVAIAAARERHWLARMPLGFVVTGYDDVAAILRDKRFHSALSILAQASGIIDDSQLPTRRRDSILTMEGDEHARVRRLVSGAFTPKSADRLRPFMREVIDDLIDAIASTGKCELVTDICEPYPIKVICELLGAPAEDWRRFSHWATEIFRIFNGDIVTDLPAISAAAAELDEYMLDLIERRRSRPADDLLSDLIAAEEAGDRLSSEEVIMLAEAVLMAGTDTTRNQLACSVALFMDHPDAWRLLAERPELAGRAVEESMRYLGTVRGTARFAAEDVEYRGVLFPKGTLVATSLVGANFDPKVWNAPDEFSLEREQSAPHMTFGSGIHFCLGAALARAELHEALPVLAQRLPDLALDGPIEWKPPTVGIWGPSRLPLRFSTE